MKTWQGELSSLVCKCVKELITVSISKKSPHDRFDVTGAWLEGDDVGDREFIKIGDLELESGEVLTDVTIAYQSWGTLNAARDNAILVNHAMTGWSDVPGWWPSMVGPGLPLDTDK